MIQKGYCFECEYEGKFTNRHSCPKCKSEDIEIYDDDEFYENDDDGDNEDDYVNFDEFDSSGSDDKKKS